MSGVLVPPTPTATLAAGISLPLVSGILVALRFYSRRARRANLYVEDWLTIPAWLLILGMGICLVYGVKNEALAHPTPRPANMKDLPYWTAPVIILNRQLDWGMLVMHIPQITCVKLAFLFFYKRIFCMPMRTNLTYIVWFLIFLCGAWGISFFFGFLFLCKTNFSAFWGTPIEFKSHCWHNLEWNLAMTGSDFALDTFIFIFPIPLLWRLQMSTARKFGVLCVFMVGGLALAGSITRLVIFVRAIQRLRKAYAYKGFDNGPISAGLYWTTFECGIALIAVCLPSVYGLVKQFLVKYFGFGTTSSDKKTSNDFSGGFARAGAGERHVRLAGSETDTMDVPVVTTNIHVDYGKHDGAEHFELSNRDGQQRRAF